MDLSLSHFKIYLPGFLKILSSLFAASATHDLLGGYLWAVVAVGVSAACTGLADRIEQGRSRT
jgi:hypothetical protein